MRFYWNLYFGMPILMWTACGVLAWVAHDNIKFGLQTFMMLTVTWAFGGCCFTKYDNERRKAAEEAAQAREEKWRADDALHYEP